MPQVESGSAYIIDLESKSVQLNEKMKVYHMIRKMFTLVRPFHPAVDLSLQPSQRYLPLCSGSVGFCEKILSVSSPGLKIFIMSKLNLIRQNASSGGPSWQKEDIALLDMDCPDGALCEDGEGHGALPHVEELLALLQMEVGPLVWASHIEHLVANLISILILS